MRPCAPDFVAIEYPNVESADKGGEFDQRSLKLFRELVRH